MHFLQVVLVQGTEETGQMETIFPSEPQWEMPQQRTYRLTEKVVYQTLNGTEGSFSNIQNVIKVFYL